MWQSCCKGRNVVMSIKCKHYITERKREKLPLQEGKPTEEFSHAFQAQIAILSRNFHKNLALVDCRQFLQKRIWHEIFSQRQLEGLENLFNFFWGQVLSVVLTVLIQNGDLYWCGNVRLRSGVKWGSCQYFNKYWRIKK